MRVNTLKHCMFWYSMILMVKFQCNINSCTILLFKVRSFCKNSVSIRFPNLWYVSLLKCKLPQHDVKMNLLHSKPASVFQSKSGSDCSSTVNFFAKHPNSHFLLSNADRRKETWFLYYMCTTHPEKGSRSNCYHCYLAQIFHSDGNIRENEAWERLV